MLGEIVAGMLGGIVAGRLAVVEGGAQQGGEAAAEGEQDDPLVAVDLPGDLPGARGRGAEGRAGHAGGGSARGRAALRGPSTNLSVRGYPPAACLSRIDPVPSSRAQVAASAARCASSSPVAAAV